MNFEFPGAVPEIPVSDLNKAVAYYGNNLGFSIDWGAEGGGIAGISKGHCRMFLTDDAFREHYHNAGPVLVWLNLNSKEQSTSCSGFGVVVRRRLFQLRHQSHGDCMSSQPLIPTAICLESFMILPLPNAKGMLNYISLQACIKHPPIYPGILSSHCARNVLLLHASPSHL